jgi:hypothetical protein
MQKRLPQSSAQSPASMPPSGTTSPLSVVPPSTPLSLPPVQTPVSGSRPDGHDETGTHAPVSSKRSSVVQRVVPRQLEPSIALAASKMSQLSLVGIAITRLSIQQPMSGRLRSLLVV